MNCETKPRRRWFQFRLRTVLIVVAVLAAPMAWVGYQLHWKSLRHHALNSGKIVMFERSQKAPGGLWLFNHSGRAVIYTEPSLPQDELARLQQLFPEARIVAVRPPYGD